MTLLNPGKRGFYTLLSVLLIIGIPGVIAYADSSNDTYYSNLNDSVLPDYVQYKNGGTAYSFAATASEADEGLDIFVESTSSYDNTTTLASLTAVTNVMLSSSSSNLGALFDKIEISTDLENISSVLVTLRDSSDSYIGALTLEYDSDRDLYFYEVTALDHATYPDVGRFIVQFNLSNSIAALSEFSVNMQMYNEETIFTDDMVELIVLVGGIALLIVGTFSLSFIDLDTPGKAANSLVRGAKSAGRKVSSYAKGRGKK